MCKNDLIMEFERTCAKSLGNSHYELELPECYISVMCDGVCDLVISLRDNKGHILSSKRYHNAIFAGTVSYKDHTYVLFDELSVD